MTDHFEMFELVAVTLADPGAPEGTVKLVKLPGIVQAKQEDGKADLTVFASAAFKERGACFLLEGVEFDEGASRAPSYASISGANGSAGLAVSNGLAITSTSPAAIAAPVALAAPTVKKKTDSHGRRVFGSGSVRHSVSKPRRVFDGAAGIGKGDKPITEAQAQNLIARVGSPRAAVAGQKAPRVFMKNRGEITPKRKQETPEDILTAVLGEMGPASNVVEMISDASDGAAEATATNGASAGGGNFFDESHGGGGQPA
jgi:hypothetical protein